MRESTRHKLHFGPYRPPRFKVGDVVRCAVLGKVRVVAISNGRIQWPLATFKRPIIFGSIARAIQKESPPALAYWFGLSRWKIYRLRAALGVRGVNVGTTRLRRRYAKEPWFAKMQNLAWAKAQDPERREKIAAARRGKPRSPEVIAALRQANLGRKLTDDQRRKMSEAHKRRGTRPPKAGKPWAAWEDDLCKTAKPSEVVEKTGRSLSAVFSRRAVLKVADGRKRNYTN